MVTIKFRKTSDDVNIPAYQTEGSAGFDVESKVWVKLAGQAALMIPTGLHVEIPEGYELQVRSRSGLAAKHGVFVLNSPGTIDSDFRGEIQVVLANFSRQTYYIEKGDRIAQLVLARVYQADIQDVQRLTDTARGDGGWGSTGW